jgi:AmiR/NasT family two-component response regulator
VLAHDRDRTEAAQLRQALTSRVVIEQAKGVVMARCDLDEQAAFSLLRSWARSSNLRLRAVAADVVTSLVLPPPIVRYSESLWT